MWVGVCLTDVCLHLAQAHFCILKVMLYWGRCWPVVYDVGVISGTSKGSWSWRIQLLPAPSAAAPLARTPTRHLLSLWEDWGAENYGRMWDQLMIQTSSVKYGVPQAQIWHTPSSEVSISLTPIQKIATCLAGKQQKCSWWWEWFWLARAVKFPCLFISVLGLKGW